MKNSRYLFTSESVSEGHPDKVCDRISDMVVDSYLTVDPFSRVACETLTTTNKVILAGEIRGPKIEKEEDKKLQKHDVIVFKVGHNDRCHVGVYCGDDYFIHQADKILSRKELLDHRWQAKIKEVYRHSSLV